MIPERCTFCRGGLHEGERLEFIARVGDEIIVIKEVPAFVCDRCGEAYYTADISRRIDAVMKDVHEGRICARPLAAGEVDLAV
ncbi:type II toxin-antitoxin system MqsA family antitoxin [Methanofollis tationis]|uniref:Type II toxin-antitoxin system MqsA family antitoxin n=1 Tax=Methanofollis tationis TaxID=81417 RepID=A0A7K4HSD6_9EURY|nr:type II toxin-antitoxin system MqsA family antitoxin [Methanofollis tationis]NVO67778.1 type II toxin-antitoxin system MqsA family antitoxin [Methanofollis tationis]